MKVKLQKTAYLHERYLTFSLPLCFFLDVIQMLGNTLRPKGWKKHFPTEAGEKEA